MNLETYAIDAFALGDKVLKGLELTAFACVVRTKQNQEILNTHAEWLNRDLAEKTEKTVKSLAPMFASFKAFETIVGSYTFTDWELVRTPCVSDPRVKEVQFKGGVRLGQIAIGVSALDEAHDQLIAGIMHLGGRNDIPVKLTTVTKIGRRGKSIPWIILRSTQKESVKTFLASVLEKEFDPKGAYGGEILVEKAGKDSRKPDAIGISVIDDK